MTDSKDVVEQKPGLKIRRVLGWAALGLTAVAILVLIRGSGPSNAPVHVEQQPSTPPVAQIPESPSSKANNPNADISAPAQSEAKPLSTNCHENDILSLASKETADTRSQFADNSARALSKFSNIDASARGASNEYLLFSASPENEADLRQLYTDMSAKPSIRANLCTKGFSEVQYLVRDANMNQRLVAKFQPNVLEAVKYLDQHYGATPVQ